MDDEMPTDGCLLNVQFDPPLVFDGTPERCELNNRIAALLVERDRLAAEVERLRKESELRRVNWQNAAHEGDRLRKEEEEARGRASCNAWERDRLAAENERLRVLVTAQDLSWAACRDALAVSRRWAARWKHVARLYRRLWRDAQGVAMAQADLAGELGEELARLRATFPPDAAGLLRAAGARPLKRTERAAARAWAARLDALAGEEE